VSQSNFLFGMLFAAFLVFITARGKLPTYLGFLLQTEIGARRRAGSLPARRLTKGI